MYTIILYIKVYMGKILFEINFTYYLRHSHAIKRCRQFEQLNVQMHNNNIKHGTP